MLILARIMENLNKNKKLVILLVIIFLSFLSYTIYLNNEVRDLKNSTGFLNNKINDLDNKYTIEEKNGQLDFKFSYSVEKILPSVVLIIAETPLSQLPFTGGDMYQIIIRYIQKARDLLSAKMAL